MKWNAGHLSANLLSQWRINFDKVLFFRNRAKWRIIKSTDGGLRKINQKYRSLRKNFLVIVEEIIFLCNSVSAIKSVTDTCCQFLSVEVGWKLIKKKKPHHP